MNNLQKVLLAANLLLISACASNIHRSETQADPYEEVNRKIFAFNDKVYENIYFPIIRGYRKITNQTARDRISSFVANVREPISTANYMLQLKPKETGISIARFAINSTLGLAGLFDVAGGWGLPQPATDMNETLASWCVADGPYLVVPFLAPGSARSYGGMLADAVMDPVYWATYHDANIRDKATYGFAALRYTDKTNGLMDLYTDFKENSVDLYATIRSAYLQNHRKLQCRFAKPEDDTAAHYDFDFDDMDEED